jgi:sulfoxide reductase heme-binding subunit YedZ
MAVLSRSHGLVAAELLVAVVVTNRLHGRISYRLWRRAHYLTFGVSGLATLHGVGAGTDGGSAWFFGRASVESS